MWRLLTKPKCQPIQHQWLGKKKQIEPKTLATIAAKFWKAEILMHRINKHTNEELSWTSNTFKHWNFFYIFTSVQNLSCLFISSIEVLITKVCNKSTKAMQTTQSAVALIKTSCAKHNAFQHKKKVCLVYVCKVFFHDLSN